MKSITIKIKEEIVDHEYNQALKDIRKREEKLFKDQMKKRYKDMEALLITV